MKDNSISLLTFIKMTNGIMTHLSQLLLVSVIIQIFSLASPYYMQLVLDEVVVNYDTDLLLVIAIGFTLITIFSAIANALRGLIITYFGSNISLNISFKTFDHLISLPLDYYYKRHVGDIVSRFGSLSQIQKMITNNMIESIIDGIMALTTLIMIYVYHYQLAIIVSIFMGLYLIIRLIWYRPLKILSEKQIESKADENNTFMENVRGIQNIKLFGMENQRKSKWESVFSSTVNYNIKISKLSVAYNFTKNMLFGLENIIVIYLGAKSIIEPEAGTVFTVGMLMAFMAYKTQLTQRFSSLVDKVIEFKMLSIHLDRLSDILMSDKENLSGEIHINSIKGKIDLREVKYSYGEHDVINYLSMNINVGESVAIIGSSGCGKTTLIKLMLGLIKCHNGTINIDDVDIKSIDKKFYRENTAAVMQSDQLLSGSIFENISNFEEKACVNDVISCAKLASIHEDIIKMPLQYDTQVGDMGCSLSGGQKQRILIARALYHKPKILFMDEATSHLDIKSEQKVNNAIRKMNITRIFIAHRPETIRSADRIYTISDGKALEIEKSLFSSEKK